MTTSTIATGDHGELRIDVASITGGTVCDFYIRSTSVVAVPGLNWNYKLNSGAPSNAIFDFQPTTLWQHLGTVVAGVTDTVTLRLENTGTAQLGGPTDLVVDLSSTSPSAPTLIGISAYLPTGDHGQLRIDNLTNTESKNCDFYIRSTSIVSVPTLGWGWSVNGLVPELKTFNFQPTTLWQHMGIGFVGHASIVTLHLTDTGTAQLGGPTDLILDLKAATSTVFVNVDGLQKLATPFANDDGVWKPLNVFANRGGTWIRAS